MEVHPGRERFCLLRSYHGFRPCFSIVHTDSDSVMGVVHLMHHRVCDCLLQTKVSAILIDKETCYSCVCAFGT